MANNNTYYGTVTTSASGFTAVFTFACPYIQIQNTGTGIIYVTSDGKTVPTTAGGDGIFEVPANSTLLIPNQGLGTWHQSQAVIALGTMTAPTPVWTPSEPQPYGSSLAGGKADPGVSLNWIGSAASTFVASAAG